MDARHEQRRGERDGGHQAEDQVDAGDGQQDAGRCALASSTPPLSTQLETTFVAVSSSAERASDGTITACAGRVIVTAVAATTAPA